MMTSRRGVAAILLAAVLIQAASAATCAVKGKVAGKAVSPDKTKFKGSLCWDGLVTPATAITFTWAVSTSTHYRFSVFGNFSTLSPASAKVAEILPAIGYVKKLEGTATAEERIAGGAIPNKLTLAKLFCSGDAGVGVVALDSSKAPKVIASAKLEVPKSAAEQCKALL
ncbi:hypothetical protein Rsub_03263 [Raphidocelis subcapitata]|uniref:Uncharacterized protein n=1 Tax=Raphidocelis subcapitata TaxID=307507 RepID=A0A2V0NX28_9CHLO|nr:hypothetical protein Rsub_03263 [Raphidocelis subcapitata]|eukprot:GBF90130.1 hypothetical protein Rsub_03263 [Raphidocelis subcapitata]